MSSKSLLTIDELSKATGLSVRTLRYYVTLGIVDRPTGETKSARYNAHHLEQVRNVRALQEQGLTLSRILEIKKQTQEEQINRKEIGEPLTRIEIPLSRGITIAFQQELCGLTKPQMLETAESLMEIIKSELHKIEKNNDGK